MSELEIEGMKPVGPREENTFWKLATEWQKKNLKYIQ